jgi:hypothetical protein
VEGVAKSGPNFRQGGFFRRGIVPLGKASRAGYTLGMKRLVHRIWPIIWPYAVPAVYFVVGLIAGLMNNPE